MENDLISRSALLDKLQPFKEGLTIIFEGLENGIEKRLCSAEICGVLDAIIQVKNAPAVEAVEVTGQELQFLIDAMYRHIRWMIAGRLDKPECSYAERVALLERLILFEREHFPDMQAETEG